MTTRDLDNILVLTDGFVYVAPKGTTAPTDTSTAWGAGWADAGWLSDAGIGEAKNAQSTKKYGINGAVVKIVYASDERTFTFECEETTALILGLTRPGSSTTTVTGTNTTNVVTHIGSDVRAFGIEKHYVDGAGNSVIRRQIVPTGQATLTETMTEQYSNQTTYKFSVDCLPDSNGVLYVDINDNPAEAAS